MNWEIKELESLFLSWGFEKEGNIYKKRWGNFELSLDLRGIAQDECLVRLHYYHEGKIFENDRMFALSFCFDKAGIRDAIIREIASMFECFGRIMCDIYIPKKDK